jgi:hypothetical protein
MTTTLSYTIDVTIDDARSYTRLAQQALLVRFLKWVLRGIEKRMLRNFTRLNVEFEGLLNMLTESKDLVIMDEDFKQFRSVVNLLTSLNEKYREINYMGNAELAETMNRSLMLSYEIEAEMKLAAKSKQQVVPTDAEYKNALANTSKHALSKKFAHQF